MCTKKRRFLFWRFVKEQMRSRLLRPRTIKGRKKRDGRAWATQSNRTNVPNARGTRRFFFWSWSSNRLGEVEPPNGFEQIGRDDGYLNDCLCVNLALVRTKWLEAEKRLGFVEPLNWLERWCRNKGSLDVFPLKRIDRCHHFRGVFCPVLSGQWGLCASFVLAFFYLCSSIVLSYF